MESRTLGQFFGHRRVVASGTTLSLASAMVVVLAFNSHGIPSQHISLNDGGVWVTNDEVGQNPSSPRGAFARLNKPIGEFDASFAPPGTAQTSYNVDVFQDGSTVLARDLAAGKLYRVNVAVQIADPTQSLQVPDADQVALGASTVAIVEPSSGKAWVRSVDDLANFSLDSKPDVTAGAGAALAVSQDGAVFVASAAKHQLVTIRPSIGHRPVVTSTPIPEDLTNLAITAVGDAPVVLDQKSGVTFLSGRASQVALPSSPASTFALQQAGPPADSVLIGGGSALYAVPLKNSGRVTTVSSAGTGQPARPVRLGGCVYSAWAGGAGALARVCGTDNKAYPLSAMGTIGHAGLVFRVNRNVIVLNDPATGATADITQTPKRVDDWDDVKPAVQNADKGARTQGKQAGSTSSDHSLKAVADTVGARPGRVTVLHVLDNDSAAENDILAVASMTAPDNSAVSATVTPDGQSVAVNVPASVTSGEVHFTYTASDEKGQTSSAPVTLQIRTKDQNERPAERPGLVAKQWSVGPSGVFSYPVLSDWRDFDGDSLVLKSVSSAAGTVSASADGRITVTAPATPGPQRITYSVWDGIGDPVTGTLDINVLDPNAAAVPATAEPDAARAFVGQQVTIMPLANDIAGADPSNPQARLTLSGTIASPSGGTVTSDDAAGAVSFTAEQVGTFELDYQAAFGSAKTAPGQIRVDVVAAPATRGGPVTMPDIAMLKGQQPSMVDVLANDTDPSGGVLTVESAAPADEQAGLQVSLVRGRWLRIVATTPDIGGPRIVHYEVTNGTSPAVTGDVTVTQLPASIIDALPIAEDDSAVVRAGDVVSVDVLDNDTDPTGGSLTLAQGGLPTRPQLGGAYASGNVVRYAAPASVQTATFVVVDYVVQNASGGSATGHVDITVNPVDAAHDSPPHPQSLEARAGAGGTVTVNVPIYNVDPDGDSVAIVGISKAPQLGQVVSFARDSIVYSAYATSAGTDVFEYQVQDRFGQIGTAQVRVGIVPAGTAEPAVAVADTLTAAPGAKVHIDVLANDFIAAGDHVTVEPLAKTNTVVPAGVSLDGTLVLVTAPLAGAEPVVFSYGITDGTGAVSIALVTVRSKPGFDIPPIARDDTVKTLPTNGSTVTVAVLDNDDDPQGDRADLKVTKVFDPQVVISGGSLVIPIQAYAQTIGYQISDPAGSVAMAAVNVPGRLAAAAPPKLKPDVQPVEIPQGGEKSISLADYVIDPRGKSVRLTTNDKISGSPADSLQAQSKGDNMLLLHSVGNYSGPGTVTFEVTDGATLSDPAGLKATLTVPVKIGAAPPALRCPSTPLHVTAGGAPVTVDITALCQVTVGDPTQLAGLKFSSSLASLDGVKLAASGTNGKQLEVTAGPGAKPNATGAITVGIVGTQAHATLTVAVVAAPLATVTNIAVGGVKAGQTATVDVASYVQSPFGASATIQILGVKQTSAGSKATTSVSGTKVSVTPSVDAHGTFTFSVSVTDLAADPNRTVQATITMEVLGVPSAPGVPTLSSVATHTVVLGFSPSASNGAPVDRYEIADSSGKTYSCAAAPCTVTGLTNGEAYTFTARAHNDVGWSAISGASQAATPDQVPDPVGGLTAVAADSAVTLQWTAAHVDGTAVTGYDVQISPDPGSGPVQKTTGTSLTWTGLTNGTQYNFQVKAENAAGPGQFGAPAQATPFGKPKTMAAPSASAVQSADLHEKAVTVSWAAADGNGRDVTGYLVTAYHNGVAAGTQSVAAPQTQTSFAVANDGSTYTYSVTATNAENLTSDPSLQSSPPITAASQPDPIGSVNASASAGSTAPGYDKTIRVSFTLPQPNGATLTRVEYQVSGGGGGSWSSPGSPGSSVTETIGGLTNGTSYTVTVRGCNETSACGAWSAASNAAIPYGVPATPTAGASVAADGKSIVWSWGGGGGNGRPIANYQISVDGGGWQDKGASPGSATQTFDYSQTHSVRVQVVDSAGQVSGIASAQATTGAPPAPTPTPTPQPPAQSIGIGWSSGHPGWIYMTFSGWANGSYTYSCDFASGGDQSYPFSIGSNPQTFDGGNTCYDHQSGDTVWVTVNGVTSNQIRVP